MHELLFFLYVYLMMHESHAQACKDMMNVWFGCTYVLSYVLSELCSYHLCWLYCLCHSLGWIMHD